MIKIGQMVPEWSKGAGMDLIGKTKILTVGDQSVWYELLETFYSSLSFNKFPLKRKWACS